MFFRLKKIQKMELNWNNAMESPNTLIENESSTTLEDFRVTPSSEFQISVRDT